MSARAGHYMADRIRALLENWARWPGWASGGSSRSTLAWLDSFVANKRVGEFGPSIPVMGGEAADTQRALGRMAPHLSSVLVAHYTWRGKIADKVADLNKPREAKDRISKRTYFRRLDEAHPAFMVEFNAVQQSSRMAAAANATASSHAPAAVARRHRLVVTSKMGLKVAEKTTTDQRECED